MSENNQLVPVQAFIAQLYQSGVRDVCISPGSRSTPLTMAFIRHGGFALWSVLDERSSGFFAAGLARGKREPVVLVCTSGTATGNYLPAVMEAHNDRLPLLVLTADRPPELYDTGANQTVPQTGLYGTLVKWHHHMPVPEKTPLLIRHAISAAARAVAVSKAAPRGPVHINWPFREPLIIPSEPFNIALSPEEDPNSRVQVWPATAQMDDASVRELRNLFNQHSRGLVVCGPSGGGEEEAAAIVQLAEHYGWPILADPLSQVRSGPHSKSNVAAASDTLLRHERFRTAAKPSMILRFGAAMTSKVANQFLAEHLDVVQVVVDEANLWVDPTLTASDVVSLNPVTFCRQILDKNPERISGESQWLSWWRRANTLVVRELQEDMDKSPWHEGQLVPELLQVLPNPVNIFVGNSMPIRDFDSFMMITEKQVRLFSNRGVSGIDGVVSSAIGVAASSLQPTVLVIGDVSFYHDMNALLIAKRHGLDLLVVVVNNNGGGIFSFLPQAEYPDTFAHFQTEHGLQFGAAAQLYGASHRIARDWLEFRSAMGDMLPKAGVRIVEAMFHTPENRQYHHDLFQKVHGALDTGFFGEDLPWKS